MRVPDLLRIAFDSPSAPWIRIPPQTSWKQTPVGIQTLTRELVILNVGPMATTFESGNTIYDPKTLNIPERGDIVLDTWGAHIFALLENRN